MVNSSRGGGSKDTWVLVPPGEPETGDPAAGQAALALAGQPGMPVMAPPPLPREDQVSRESGPPMEDQQQ